MENASKALIIAGSILIALMIIGAVILMFNSLSNYQNMNDKDVKEAQIVKFNNQYETYNRDNVRGSDLYSLLNRVVDYNRRKSDKATGLDEGQDLQFQAMTIIINFGPNYIQESTYDGIKRLLPITNNRFELNQRTSNDFYDAVNTTVKNIEDNYGGKNSAHNLASGISNLVVTATSPEEDRIKAADLYKNNTGDSSVNKNNIANKTNPNTGSAYKDICTYYEFIQFKRAYFKCTDTGYNQNTGRIISMTFTFDNRFE